MRWRLLGRDRTISQLLDRFRRCEAGQGGLVLVTGEAGIGKTAVVTELAVGARAAGGLVLVGTCWDPTGAPGYWPWRQIVRELRWSVPRPLWQEADSAAGEGLARLLGGSAATPSASTSEGSFLVHDAVTTALATVARSRATLVVIEDLHKSDVGSLRLLEFLVRHAWSARLLIIATYRDIEVQAPDHPLAGLLASLTTAPTITLTGLEPDDVARLVQRVADRVPDGDVIQDIHRRTGGNPFFVEQLARLWPTGTTPAALPPGVRATVDRWLFGLPEPVHATLADAAVLGREFSRRLLAAMRGVPAAEVDVLLDAAVAARLVVPGSGGSFEFVHDVVRETVYAGLGADLAAQRHAAVVRAVQRESGLADCLVPAVTAWHAWRAVGRLGRDEVVRWLTAAAEDASGRLAADEAVDHYRRVLRLLPDRPSGERARVGLRLGAELQRAGDLAAARTVFDEVVAVARDLEDAPLFADAVLAIYGAEPVGGDWQEEIELVNEARARLDRAITTPDELLSVRSRLLAVACRTVAYQAPGRESEARSLSGEAVRLARRSGDLAAIGLALLACRDSTLGPGAAGEPVTVADDLAVVVQDPRHRVLAIRAALSRAWALVQRNDPEGLREARRVAAWADDTRLPRLRYEAACCWGTVAVLSGDVVEAERQVELSARLGQELGEWWEATVRRQQRWALAELTGDHTAAARELEAAVVDGHPYPTLLEAMAALSRGETDRPRRFVVEVLAHGERFSPWFGYLWLTFAARLAAHLGDRALCEETSVALEPLQEEWAVVAGGAVVLGPVRYWLALVLAAQERWDSAIVAFRRAADDADRMGARPWAIRARLGLAETLLRRGGDDARHQAARFAGAASQQAAALGLSRLAVAAEAFTEQAAVVSPLTADVVTRGRLVLDGGVWTLEFGGRTVHMPDAKGLGDLSVLLARPGADVPAVDLAYYGSDEGVEVVRGLGSDPVLDDTAREAYRRRLSDIEDQVATALARHQDWLAAELDREREQIVDELRRQTGFAGRRRRLGGEAERARKAVTARIRDVFRRLETPHPELVAHLRDSVSTGVTCRYRPHPPVRWEVRRSDGAAGTGSKPESARPVL